MKKDSYIRFIFASAFLLLTLLVSAQEGFKDEEAMAKKADVLFKKEAFRQAFEYYQTLLSNHRESTLYSYRFGVCLMYSDKADKEKPIKYIAYAAKDSTMDHRVFYYLGRAYHQNYRFTEAKNAYKKYRSLAKNKAITKFDIDRRIQECNNGLSLLSNIHLLYVINKVEVKESSFYRTYNMKSSGGIVIVKPEQLITRYDKRHNKDFTAFYIPENRIIYYSSYGDKGENGKDIYRSHQLGGGQWSEPQVLSSNINTKYDEAYPFITKDGETMYFSSKGHNSMGGYDIFKSTFNSGTFEWMPPENMNFPINTPFEDIFYVPDTASRFANFASTRSSVDGLIYVYKIGIDKKEEQQDFAKILKEGGDVEAAIRLIKDVADMKTNINISDYKTKMSVLSDSSDITQNATNENDSLNNEDVKKSQLIESEISVADAVDSTFASYRKMKNRIAGLKKQKKSIQKVYLKNNKLAEEIYANMGGEGEREAAKYKEAATVALKVDHELSQEIANSEWAADKMIELASNMQYYQANGKKDSVLAIYNQVINLGKGVSYNDNYADKLVDTQSDIVKNKREQASKYYELSQSIDKEIESLKTEREEYVAALAKTEDENEKVDYQELITGMDDVIAKKEALKTKYVNDWKSERQSAEDLATQSVYTKNALSDYYDETKDVDFNSQNNLTEADKQEMEQRIAEVQSSKPTHVVDVSFSDKPIIASTVVVPASEKIALADNNEENKNKGDKDYYTDANVGGEIDSSIVVGSEDVDSTAIAENNEVKLIETPEAVQLLAKVDEDIAELAKTHKENQIKENIALKLGAEKYDEYQKLNDELEANYAKLSLNSDISTEEKVKELQKLKNDLTDAEDIKKQAAAAFGIAKIYKQKNEHSKDLLTQAENEKVKIVSYLENNDFENAQVASANLTNKTESVSEAITVDKKQISVLEKEENKLVYQSDSLNSIISTLKNKQKVFENGSEDYKKIAANIETQNESIDNINNKIDVVRSNKQALVQMRSIENLVIVQSAQSVDTVAFQPEIKVPDEMRKQDNLIAAFSNQKLNRQLKAIDETISETIIAQEQQQEQQQIAEWEAMDLVEIPNYTTTEQNNTAKEVVKPRVDAIIATQEKNKELEKKVAVSLIAAKDYNKQLKAKTEELEELYAKIDTTITLKEQPKLVEKIKTIEKEQLALNQKQEAAIQYANILNKEQKENERHIANLSTEVIKAKSFIARKQLDSATALSQQVEMLAAMTNHDDFLDAYLQTYRNENKLIDDKISKITSSSSMKMELDSLKALKAQNRMVMEMIQSQAEYVKDEQRLAQVDSTMIARSNVVPIVAINSDIFNPNYLQSNGLIEELEEKESQLEQSENQNREVTQLDEAVITASRINRNEIPYIKRALVNREITSIDKEIKALTKIQDESLDEVEVHRIDSTILVLSNDKEEIAKELKPLNKQIARMESKGYTSNFNAKELDIDVLLSELTITEDSLIERARNLRDEANNLDGKNKKVALAKAQDDEKIAFELGLASVDIIAKQNNLDYHENNAKIAVQLANNETGFASDEVKNYSRKAIENQVAAAERRKLLAKGGYSNEEQKKIVEEAEKYEGLAIQNQQKLLQIVGSGVVVAQNVDTNQRTAEEIPFDEKDDLNKEKNQEIAADNENIEKENALVVVPILKPSEDSAFVQNQDSVQQFADANSIDNKKTDERSNDNQEAIVENADTQKGNALVVVPILKPSEDSVFVQNQDSVQQLADANHEDNKKTNVSNEKNQDLVTNDKKTDNATELVVVPILRPTEKDSAITQSAKEADKVNSNDNLADNSSINDGGYGIITNAKIESVNTEAQIPDNVDLLPMGLVFKVQMAAFKRRMPPSTFPGISPIAAEKIPNSSFIRYVGGIFPNYNYAIPARDAIRARGFSDAFIVAYFDGQRISIAQARRLIKARKAYTTDGLVQFAIRNNTIYYVRSQIEEQVANSDKKSLAIPSIEEMDQSQTKQDFTNVSSKGMGISFNKNAKKGETIQGSQKLDGLVFKVQVEALKTEVSLDYFKGISPIVKEKHSGSNLNYYVAGSFPNYISAAKARDQIHEKGYPSAFVVVYFNGQRISTESANQLIKEGKAFTTPSLAKYASENNTDYYSNKSNDVGLSVYYSVQIGVFGAPRSASRLFNLNSLYFNRTNKGYYRYFSGKYSSESVAKSARDQIRQLGIKDAFVVAFQNGKRISLTAARKIEADAKAKNIVINRKGASSKAVVAGAPKTKQNAVAVVDANAESGIVFKVQLGAYKGTRNSTQLKLINSMSENGISSYTTASGLTIYFTNSYKNYQEAKSAQARIRAAGHGDVFVVALQNGSKINIRKALDMMKQK